MKTFAERLRAGERLVGTIVTLPAPSVSELLSQSGLDWLWIDTEHAPIDGAAAQMLLQAARIPCVVRTADGSEPTLKKALDMGADGVIVPLVNTAEQARAIVACCKYPPTGRRAVGLVRAQDYGFNLEETVRTANERTSVIVQIEHIEGVRNIDAICAVPGIDAVFVGPFDLSGSMGLTGQVTHPEVQQAIARVRAAAQKAGRRLGIYGHTPDRALPFLEQGYTLIAVGMDTSLLGAAAREVAAAFRAAPAVSA
jgi:2-dehydro-3-deoxyglucarate aldolase/4-hydroxy-2-oxoheptanedioate aldolase